MPATAEEMQKLIDIVSRLSDDQIRTLNTCIKARREVATMEAINTFRVGDKVRWTGKAGSATGIVEKVKQKYVLVLQDGPRNLHWNVPATMLTKVSP